MRLTRRILSRRAHIRNWDQRALADVADSDPDGARAPRSSRPARSRREGRVLRPRVHGRRRTGRDRGSRGARGYRGATRRRAARQRFRARSAPPDTRSDRRAVGADGHVARRLYELERSVPYDARRAQQESDAEADARAGELAAFRVAERNGVLDVDARYV